ncbi:hypothetical protein A254_01883 (plasmid) [Zymomonas mobilis subsp. mobilis NRRL B-12526]|nr:hypothetical protein A254_01883 [Zymomonas mobilis subsp. mobilis NRRL B-12526]
MQVFLLNWLLQVMFMAWERSRWDFGMQERVTSWAWQAVTGSIRGGWESCPSREKPVTSLGIPEKAWVSYRPDMEQKVSGSMTGSAVRSQNSTDPTIRRMIAEHGFGDCSCVEIQLMGISPISLSGALMEQYLKSSFRSKPNLFQIRFFCHG